MFKAIFWDNDGVLVDTEKFYYLANKKLLSRYRIELTEELFRDLKRAGLTCWVVPNRLSTHGDFSQADKVLSNIGEVARLLLNDSMDTSPSAEGLS
jgi:phosphoglycolate phosphatase-like HAD superfamily hydrolase